MALIPGTLLRVAHLNYLVLYSGPGVCRRGWKGCRRQIIWAVTANGRPIALDPTPNAFGYYVAHRATCPVAHQFLEPRR